MSIAEQLKKKRIELQMSQEVAADKAGISRRTLAYYETGERVPNAENLLILCNIYGLNVNELISTDIKDNDGASVPANEKIEVLSKIDAYLQHEQDKKNFYRKGAFYCALGVSIATVLLFTILVIMKFVLMANYDYSFSEATAKMWTSLLEAMIRFVNDPEVQGFPVVSVGVTSFIAVCWIIYFIVRVVRHNREK